MCFIGLWVRLAEIIDAGDAPGLVLGLERSVARKAVPSAPITLEAWGEKVYMACEGDPTVVLPMGTTRHSHLFWTLPESQPLVCQLGSAANSWHLLEVRSDFPSPVNSELAIL